MLSHLLWVVSFYVLFTLNTLGASLSPTAFRLSLERSYTQEVTVANSENKSLRYRVNIEKPSNQKDPNLYMGEWIRYYPKILSVPPKSSRVVRFRVTPPEGLEDGEYRAYLALEEIPPKKEIRSTATPEEDRDENDSRVSLTSLMVFKLSIYGEKGKITPKVEFLQLDIVQNKEEKDKLNIKGKVINKGNVSVKSVALITFKDSKNKKSGEIVEVLLPIIIRENTAQFNIAFDKPKGDLKIAEIELRQWTSEKIGELVIEQKRIEL